MSERGLNPQSLIGLSRDEAVKRVAASGMRVKVADAGAAMSMERGINRVVLIIPDGIVVDAYEA